MADNDAIFVIGVAFGLIAGFWVGHGRGYIAGVRWCTKRLDEPVPQDDALTKHVEP